MKPRALAKFLLLLFLIPFYWEILGGCVGGGGSSPLIPDGDLGQNLSPATTTGGTGPGGSTTGGGATPPPGLPQEPAALKLPTIKGKVFKCVSGVPCVKLPAGSKVTLEIWLHNEEGEWKTGLKKVAGVSDESAWVLRYPLFAPETPPLNKGKYKAYYKDSEGCYAGDCDPGFTIPLPDADDMPEQICNMAPYPICPLTPTDRGKVVDGALDSFR